MLTAVKGNREAKINDDQKEEFLKSGYDIIDENGKRTISPSKKVSYAEYKKALEENSKLKGDIKNLKAKIKELEEAQKAGA